MCRGARSAGLSEIFSGAARVEAGATAGAIAGAAAGAELSACASALEADCGAGWASTGAAVVLVSVSAALGLLFAAAERPLPAPERALAGFSVLGAEAFCVASSATGLPVLADCATPSSTLAVALGLREPVPREVERPVAVLAVLWAVLLAVGAAAVAASAVAAAPGAAAASGAAAEISLDGAAVLLLLVEAASVVLPALPPQGTISVGWFSQAAVQLTTACGLLRQLQKPMQSMSVF